MGFAKSVQMPKSSSKFFMILVIKPRNTINMSMTTHCIRINVPRYQMCEYAIIIHPLSVSHNLFISTDNQHLTFRGNSIGTKAMEAYMKLVGEKVCGETFKTSAVKKKCSFYCSTLILIIKCL